MGRDETVLHGLKWNEAIKDEAGRIKSKFGVAFGGEKCPNKA